MRKNLHRFILGTFLVLSVTPTLALAVAVQSPTNTVTSIESLLDRVCTVVNILFTVLLIAAVIMIILAAFNYLTASGDPEKVKSANHQLIYAVIAVAVGFFSKAIPIIVANFLSTGAGGGGFVGCG